MNKLKAIVQTMIILATLTTGILVMHKMTEYNPVGYTTSKASMLVVMIITAIVVALEVHIFNHLGKVKNCKEQFEETKLQKEVRRVNEELRSKRESMDNSTSELEKRIDGIRAKYHRMSVTVGVTDIITMLIVTLIMIVRLVNGGFRALAGTATIYVIVLYVNSLVLGIVFDKIDDKSFEKIDEEISNYNKEIEQEYRKNIVNEVSKDGKQ